MKTFITSDLHLNHENVRTYCPKFRSQYKTVEEMNEGIIKVWNKHVSINDTVYVLGDVCMGQRKYHLNFIERLNGFIYLVPGNHDRHLVKLDKKGLLPTQKIQLLPQIHSVKLENQHFVFCHYPLDEWEGMAGHHGAVSWQNATMLHGHCHGSRGVITGPRRIDIGWDNFGKPLEVKEILELLWRK